MTLGMLGNGLVARRDLEAVARDARAVGSAQEEMKAHAELAALHVADGNLIAAERSLRRAEELVASVEAAEDALEVMLALYELSSRTRPESAAAYLKRCRELLPLARERRPAVRRFEALLGAWS
jgi:hypothetical protein